jgi:hypothetical protein
MLQGLPHTIVGVAPSGFHGTFVGYAFQFWVPASMQPQFSAGVYALEDRDARWIEGFVKLKRGISMEQAQGELSGIMARLENDYPDSNRGRGIRLYRLWETPFNNAGAMLPTLKIALGVVLAVLLIAATAYLSKERSRNPALASIKGVPQVVALLLVLLVVLTFVLNRTPFGRHIYAVGGNSEAARRAGINVDRIRISVFVICSAMAAVGGIVAASRANSVDPNTGGSNVLLYAVGAAVIGGTSLFGGRGTVVGTLIGATIVGVFRNGLTLIGVEPIWQYFVTGILIILAVSVDQLTHRGRG